jgi:hypothetical protein
LFQEGRKEGEKGVREERERRERWILEFV